MKYKVLGIAMASVAAAALVGVAANGQTVKSMASVTDVKVATKADNFRLVDQKSKAQELYYYKNSAAVVIISQANGAAYSKAAAPAIKALKEKYGPQNVTFLLFGDTTVDLADHVSLIDAGIIDSTGVLELVGFVENTFGLTVADADIVPANFDSIGRLAAYIEAKTSVIQAA